MPKDITRKLKRRGIRENEELGVIHEEEGCSVTYPMINIPKHIEDISLEDEEESEEESFLESVPTENQNRKKKLYPDLFAETSEKEEKHLQKDQSKHIMFGTCYNLLIIFALGSLVCFAVVSYSDMLRNPAVSSKKMKTVDVISDLKNKFNTQPKLSLKIIKSALEKILDRRNGSQPSHPAILLLLSSKGAMDITTCFAKEMAGMISQQDGGFENIKGTVLGNRNADNAKKFIDDSITKALHDKGQHVILIEDLDLIPAAAVMMLHSYCDHENAPFKDAVFIMTVNGNRAISPDTDSKGYEEAAMARLKYMWRELHDDQLYALLARITVSVAAVLPSAKFSYCGAKTL